MLAALHFLRYVLHTADRPSPTTGYVLYYRWGFHCNKQYKSTECIQQTRCGAQHRLHSVRAALRRSSVTWVDMVAPPNGWEIVLRKSRFSVGLNYGPIFRRLWAKVHQITSCRRGRDRSLQRRFPIVDILFRFGDIRDLSAKSKKACFSAPNFLGDDPKFWTKFLKLHPFPIMWQSFATIGPETA